VTEAALAGLAQQYDRLWFIPVQNSVWDPENIAFRWLDYHTLIEQQQTFDEQTLLVFRPAHAVEQVMQPLAAALDDLLALEGFYVTLNGRPLEATETITVSPDDQLTVTLIWRALAPISENYVVFVHLLDENGALIAQHDGTPLFGTRPTTTWQPGERLLDRHTLQIAAGASSGSGRLVLGLYTVDSAGTITIQPLGGQEGPIWLK
jgi:hypothetical protein